MKPAHTKNFKPEIKSIIKYLQDELYKLENKQAKGAKLRAKIKWELKGEKCSKIFFKVLERRICKIKQYLKYILMIINQNILATLLTYSNLPKNFYEKLYTKQTTSKTATTEFISKNTNRKEVSNEQFHLCEAKILYMRPQNL